MKIIDYKNDKTTVSCGFVKHNFVIYAQTGTKEGWIKEDYLQSMYEEIKPAIDYEERRFLLGESNSIIVDEEIESEDWEPEGPRVSSIELSVSENYHLFDEAEESVTITLSTILKDQYGESIEGDIVYTSDYGIIENEILTLPIVAEDRNIIVTVTVDNITDTKNILLQAPIVDLAEEPVEDTSETEQLLNILLGVEEQ